jgi:hypothetical protein
MTLVSIQDVSRSTESRKAFGIRRQIDECTRMGSQRVKQRAWFRAEATGDQQLWLVTWKMDFSSRACGRYSNTPFARLLQIRTAQSDPEARPVADRFSDITT